MRPDILVVGGGCAGLSAATALAERGARVGLLEARRVLGGRARSWLDARTGDVEDNGQHLILGCYDRFLAFLRRTGGIERLAFQDRLDVVFLEENARPARFRAADLPRPLDLLVGLLRLRGFPLRDAVAASEIARDVRKGGPRAEGISAAEWLALCGQTARARRLFWDPLVLAVLNMPAEIAPASALAAVLSRALLGGREAARFGFAPAGLSELIVEPGIRFLREHGGTVTSGSPVVRLETDGGSRFVAALGRDGERHEAGAAVLAVAHRGAAHLLSSGISEFDGEAARRLGASPILSVHLWFDREVVDDGVTALIGSDIHWIFDRHRIAGAREPGYLALVSSAADRFMDGSSGAIVEAAVREVRRFLPRARGANLRHSRVVKEREATPRFAVSNLGLRPGPRTALRNLVLAGDWTATGLPATLEGAAASGELAARVLAEDRAGEVPAGANRTAW